MLGAKSWNVLVSALIAHYMKKTPKWTSDHRPLSVLCGIPKIRLFMQESSMIQCMNKQSLRHTAKSLAGISNTEQLEFTLRGNGTTR